jgi:uncharacterized membrane protein
MIRKTILLFSLLVLRGLCSIAQDVQFVGTAKPVVAVGETFALTYTLNAQGTNFRGPSISGFDVISGPNTSTTSSIRAINGRTSMSITYTYSYYLMASREGSFEIPSAAVLVDQKQYRSNSITVKVEKGGAGQPNQGQNQPNRQNRTGQPGSSSIQSGTHDVFLKAFASNSDPLQGEGIVVTYKIYTKVPINQISIKKLSSFQGFWSQNLIKENEKLNQTTQVIDGEQYIVAEIRKIALFPLKSGRLTIEPLEMECVASIKRQTKTKTGDPFFDDFFNDSFFNNSYASVDKSLKSNALTINVRALPTEEKPVDFSGAVGNFTFHTEIDKTHIKANDAVNLKCTVAGQGNLQLIDKLNVTFPPDFETYDPRISSNINTTAAGISGSQVFEYLVIPRKPGKFTIKPITFSYFDLSRKKYVTLSSPGYTLEVDKGTGDGATISYSGANKEDIKYIGSDIRHIKNPPFKLQLIGAFFFGSILFFLLLIVPIVLFIFLLLFWRKQEVRHSNTMLMKNRKATKVAKKRLKKAENFLKTQKQEPFYEEISQALWGYLSDKFSIPLAELSIDSVQGALLGKNVHEDTLHLFIETLNNTEFARFAPGEKTLIMDKIYNEALNIISKIERELK